MRTGAWTLNWNVASGSHSQFLIPNSAPAHVVEPRFRQLLDRRSVLGDQSLGRDGRAERGFGLGAINLYYILQIVHEDIAGMRLDYVFPVAVVAALVPTILASAFVAAIWPAESAVHGSLVEALEYE